MQKKDNSNQKNSETLANSITREGSKQAYYTASLLVDRDLVIDFNRAYAYFRWIDDVVDNPNESIDARITFIKQQRTIIERLYQNDILDNLGPEEQIIADLIYNDRLENSGLHSFIWNMFAIIEFDTYRLDQLISTHELSWYTERLAESVTDGLQYFIGNEYRYPSNNRKYQAGRGAHISHLLRDMINDMKNGIFNIPKEYLEETNIEPWDIDAPAFREWVKDRVLLARNMFREGKQYLDEVDIFRCKLAGYWYCERFESVLDEIEKDGYLLRENYNERYKLFSLIRLIRTSIIVSAKHFL